MMLRATVEVQRGTLALDVDFEAEAGEVIAVLGPNGAGKTTLLHCLAGLLPIDSGRIVLGTNGEDVVLDAPGEEVFVAAEARPIGVVFQDYLLFRHLSVLENVAFGLRARGVDTATARLRAHEWLRRVELDDYADARPAVLSGGQAQRVALARALATEPRLVLLDEPLAALDPSTRDEVRRGLRRLLDGYAGVSVVVTHDPVDAYTLADRVVVVEAGQVTQRGSIAEVTSRPRTDYVARLVGTNLVDGALADGRLTTASGATIHVAERAVRGPAFVTIRPQAVTLYTQPPASSARNLWRLTVGHVEHRSDRTRVALVGDVGLTAEITPEAAIELGLASGVELWAGVKATDVDAYAR